MLIVTLINDEGAKATFELPDNACPMSDLIYNDKLWHVQPWEIPEDGKMPIHATYRRVPAINLTGMKPVKIENPAEEAAP